VESPIVLGLIVLAFIVFGATLAYVSHIAARRPDSHLAE
jgi:hypothetical protein